jgi:hypothetical protein
MYSERVSTTIFDVDRSETAGDSDETADLLLLYVSEWLVTPGWLLDGPGTARSWSTQTVEERGYQPVE